MKSLKVRFFVFGCMAALALGTLAHCAKESMPTSVSAETADSGIGKYVVSTDYDAGNNVVFVTVVDSETGIVVRRERHRGFKYELIEQ